MSKLEWIRRGAAHHWIGTQRSAVRPDVSVAMRRLVGPAGVALALLSGLAHAQESHGDLEDKLNNPLASLISLPFQNNLEFGGGPDGEGVRYRLNVQPVIPFTLNERWNLVTRTIVPISYQDGFSPIHERNFELGDVQSTIFLSPRDKVAGLTLGFGPLISIPVATGHAGASQWGLGPSILLLRQDHQLTYGLLASQVWGLGDDSDPDLSSLLLQPFVSRKLGGGYTLGFNAEATYDWPSEQWTIPVQTSLSKLTTIGKQPVSLQGALRYFVEKPEGGADWGLRFTMTFPFPK